MLKKNPDAAMCESSDKYFGRTLLELCIKKCQQTSVQYCKEELLKT